MPLFTSKRARQSCLFAMALALLFLPQQAGTQNKKESEYTRLIQVEPQALKDFLKYQQSGLGSFYKLKVSVADGEGNNSTPYEELFACTKIGDQAGLIGCKRLEPLVLKDKDRVAIVFKFSDKKASEEESTLAAYAVPPLLIDARLKQDKDTMIFAGDVLVPVAQYNAVKQSLMNQGFQPSSQATAGGSASTQLFSLQLMSEPRAMFDSLFYQPSLKKGG